MVHFFSILIGSYHDPVGPIEPMMQDLDIGGNGHHEYSMDPGLPDLASPGGDLNLDSLQPGPNDGSGLAFFDTDL